MTYNSWRDAVAELQQRMSSCNAEQRRIASVLGVQIPDTLPRIVAHARVQSVLSSRFGFDPPRTSYSQYERLCELAEELSEEVPHPTNGVEAASWIKLFYLKRRAEALRDLRLEKGDVVLRLFDPNEVDEVVSIGGNGVVYFTGGGARAWPDRLKVVARSDDVSSRGLEARRVAANRASRRSISNIFSEAKERILEPYAVSQSVAQEDIDILRSTISSAQDERPIQELLEERPQLLTSLLRGDSRYCLPQVRLGSSYVADFFLADVDSNGLRWILLELETPNSSTTLTAGRDFDKHARKGVSQIVEWREWLQDNLDQARRTQNHGLGLPDIRPKSKGIVLVGRRRDLGPNASQLRNQLLEDRGIEMHTYGWLLEQVEQVAQRPWPPVLH